MDSTEIMTAEEVAQYLRVSERTVYDWAQKGEIPCGKIGNIWRFKRAAIEKWLDEKLGALKEKPAPRPIPLADVLAPERVLILQCRRKLDVLNALIESLAKTPQIKDRGALAEAIFHREELMSTGIGVNAAVPHARLTSVDRIVMAAAACPEGVDDYESMDGEPVKLVFMIAAGQDQHAQHIKLLSSLAGRLKNTELRACLLEAMEPEIFYRILVEEGL